MKTYYAIKREIFKNNSSKVDETILYPTLYKTFEDATRAARKEQDSDSKFYGYQITEQFLVSLQTVKNYKTGKETVYRHEFSIIKYELEEA